MTRRNLTLQLDDEVIRRAKVAAARRGTSISGLVARQIQDLVESDSRYDEAKRLATNALRGVTRRGGRRWIREELHAR